MHGDCEAGTAPPNAVRRLGCRYTLRRMAISHPTDPRIRGLAAAILTSDIPPWEFDIRAVEPGSDVVEISDWERRLRRKQIERGSTVVLSRKALLDAADERGG